jgi:hypothetical protein
VSSNLLFASEKYDKSDSVLRKLGIRPGKDGDNPGKKRTRSSVNQDGGGQPAKDSEQPRHRRRQTRWAGHETTPRVNTRRMKKDLVLCRWPAVEHGARPGPDQREARSHRPSGADVGAARAPRMRRAKMQAFAKTLDDRLKAMGAEYQTKVADAQAKARP